MVETRRKAYLDLFASMDPGAANALRKIYRVAKQGDEHGKHVILAMLASARHPAILKLSLSNAVIRFSLKQALLEGDLARSTHYHAVLEDFHSALDEFMAGAIPADAMVHPELHERVLNNPLLYGQMMFFKEKAAPALARMKQSARLAR